MMVARDSDLGLNLVPVLRLIPCFLLHRKPSKRPVSSADEGDQASSKKVSDININAHVLCPYKTKPSAVSLTISSSEHNHGLECVHDSTISPNSLHGAYDTFEVDGVVPDGARLDSLPSEVLRNP